MDIRIIKKIENVEDFKLLIEEVVQKCKINLQKIEFDAIVLNFEKKQMISYFENERQKNINKIKKNSFTFRVIFENEKIVINKEDYEQLFIYPNYKYEYLEQIKWNEEHFLKRKKELIIYYKKRLKDIKNSVYIAFYNTKIEELKGGKNDNETNDFYPFNKKESEDFFIYLVENWFKKVENKSTAIKYVFTEMWYKNPEKDTPFKIISTQPYFAAEYWNLKYSNIYEFPNPKNPHLNNKNINNNYYSIEFEKHLTKFKGG